MPYLQAGHTLQESLLGEGVGWDRRCSTPQETSWPSWASVQQHFIPSWRLMGNKFHHHRSPISRMHQLCEHPEGFSCNFHLVLSFWDKSHCPPEMIAEEQGREPRPSYLSSQSHRSFKRAKMPSTLYEEMQVRLDLLSHADWCMA